MELCGVSKRKMLLFSAAAADWASEIMGVIAVAMQLLSRIHWLGLAKE